MTRPFLFLLAAFLSIGAARAEVTVKVGAFVTLSGVSADVGAQMKAGMQVAVDRIAKGYAVGGQPAKVEIVWYDDEGRADVALNAVTRALTVDHVNVAVGFLSSDVYARVMEEFQKGQVPVIACCAAAMGIGEAIAAKKLTYVFQLSPTANDVAMSTIAATATLVKPKTIAMLNENTDAGRDFSRISREWLAKNAPEITVAADEFVPHGVLDLTPQLGKFKRLGVGAIVGEVYGASAVTYFQQYNELRVPAEIAHMGTSASADSFVEQNGKLMEGSLVNVRWVPGNDTPVTAGMVDAYKVIMKSSPSTFAVQAHDSMTVALEAVRQAGSLDPAAIDKAMEDGSFIGAVAIRHFTPLEAGHRMPVSTIVAQVQNGKKVIVYPVEAATGFGTAYKAVPPWSWQRD